MIAWRTIIDPSLRPLFEEPAPASERTVVDPSARSRAAAHRIAELAEQARALQEGHDHRHADRAEMLEICAEGLAVRLDHVATDILIFKHQASWHRTHVGAYHEAMLPILDEAVALLEGLR